MTYGLRIIGIKLFDTRWHTVNKTLKTGWYPFGHYPEPKEEQPYSLPTRTSIEEKLYDLYDNNPHMQLFG